MVRISFIDFSCHAVIHLVKQIRYDLPAKVLVEINDRPAAVETVGKIMPYAGLKVEGE